MQSGVAVADSGLYIPPLTITLKKNDAEGNTMVMNVLREGAKKGLSKFILFGFMGIAVGGLVFMDIGGFFTGSSIGSQNVMVIGRDKLSAVEFDRMVRRAVGRQGMDPQTAWQLGLINQLLQGEISNNLLLRAASDNGIYVGDDTIAAQVREIVTPFVDEQTTARQALQRILMSQGMGEGEFVSALRQEMTNNILRGSLFLSAGTGSAAEAQDLYEYNHESRTVKTLVLDHSQIKDVKEPGDEVLLPFYQAGQEKYAIPETRGITVAVLTEDAIKDAVKITDDEIKAQYEDQVDVYKVPEKRSLEQTIMADRAQAEAVALRAQNNEKLKDAVKAETGKTDAYLGVSEFEQKGLAKEIAEKAFSGSKGDVIGPVQSALGWHVLILTDVIAPRTRPLEEVKEEIRKTMTQTALADRMFEASGQIDDGIAAGTPLEDLAKDLGLKLEAFEPLRADGSTTDSKEGFKKFEADRAEILAAAFELQEGDMSSVLTLKDGSFAVVRVDSMTEKTYKPFDDVKAELARIWMQDQREVLNKERADKGFTRLQSGEVTLDALAKEMGVDIRTLALVRADQAPAPLNSASKTLFFEPAQDKFALAPTDTGFAIGQVTKITIPDADKAKKDELETLQQAQTRAQQDEIVLMYLESMRKKYGVKINRPVLQQMYAQPAAEDPAS